MKKIFAVLLLCLPLPVVAAPDLTRVVGETLADRGSQFYGFEQHRLLSGDGQRHYRITLATPKAAMPDGGYPVIYLLDGNAALAALDDGWLAGMTGDDWPVMVMLGYDTELYFDVQARAYDYTFMPAQPVADGRRYGGADEFWQFLEQQAKPLVRSRVQVDDKRQTLWGHSFGGLFVLHALFHYPESYQGYVAADPSLWWQDGQVMQHAQSYIGNAEKPAAMVLLQRSHSRRATDPLPEDVVRQLARRLADLSALWVEYHEYFGHNHGSLLAGSLPEALHFARQVRPE